jgi:hypothetical protein
MPWEQPIINICLWPDPPKYEEPKVSCIKCGHPRMVHKVIVDEIKGIYNQYLCTNCFNEYVEEQVEVY